MGQYIVNGKGERELVHATVDHPEGNRARQADGTPIVEQPTPEPAADVAPADKRKKS